MQGDGSRPILHSLFHIEHAVVDPLLLDSILLQRGNSRHNSDSNSKDSTNGHEELNVMFAMATAHDKTIHFYMVELLPGSYSRGCQTLAVAVDYPCMQPHTNKVTTTSFVVDVAVTGLTFVAAMVAGIGGSAEEEETRRIPVLVVATQDNAVQCYCIDDDNGCSLRRFGACHFIPGIHSLVSSSTMPSVAIALTTGGTAFLLEILGNKNCNNNEKTRPHRQEDEEEPLLVVHHLPCLKEDGDVDSVITAALLLPRACCSETLFDSFHKQYASTVVKVLSAVALFGLSNGTVRIICLNESLDATTGTEPSRLLGWVSSTEAIVSFVHSGRDYKIEQIGWCSQGGSVVWMGEDLIQKHHAIMPSLLREGPLSSEWLHVTTAPTSRGDVGTVIMTTQDDGSAHLYAFSKDVQQLLSQAKLPLREQVSRLCNVRFLTPSPTPTVYGLAAMSDGSLVGIFMTGTTTDALLCGAQELPCARGPLAIFAESFEQPADDDVWSKAKNLERLEQQRKIESLKMSRTMAGSKRTASMLDAVDQWKHQTSLLVTRPINGNSRRVVSMAEDITDHYIQGLHAAITPQETSSRTHQSLGTSHIESDHHGFLYGGVAFTTYSSNQIAFDCDETEEYACYASLHSGSGNGSLDGLIFVTDADKVEE
jgi:hypothetical protein